MSEYAIGLDLGGGSVRCLVLDLETSAVTCAARKIASTPAPGTSGLGFDLDLEKASAGLAGATREALARAGARADEVAAIACTGMRLGTVVVADDGEVLLSVPNRDARAVGPGLILAMQHGDALQQLTGHWPLPIYGAARLRFLVETRPEDLARAAHYLSLSDWMTHHLCGEVATEPSQAAESLLFDVSSGEWAWDWIDRLEIPRRLFPAIGESGSQVGSLGAEAAEAFGLKAGTPVVLGGADTQCGLLGGGAVSPGDVTIVGGTTVPIQLVLDEPVIDAEARVWTGRHVLPGQWVLESNAGPAGDSLDWMGRILYPDAPASLGGTAMLLGEAATSEPGARGLLSSVGVEVMNAKESALPIGQLTLTHMTSAADPAPRSHLARAIAEGVACGLRANVEQVRSIAGVEAGGGVRLVGGLSRSRFLGQLVANVLGEPVSVSLQPEATALGAALCAGVGASRWPDLAAAGREQAADAEVLSPDAETAEVNQDLFARWSELRADRRAADVTASRMTTPYVLKAQTAAATATGERARPRILITSDCDDASLQALEQLGDVTYASFRDAKRMLTGPSLVKALDGVNVFVTEIDLVDAAALEQLPDLRVIVSCRGDAVNVDADACTAFGVPMLRTPGRNADAVADLTLAFLLMLARKLPEASEFLREPGIAPGDMGKMGQAFGRFRGLELWQKTVGLVGLGAVGKKVAERLRPFGTRVLVADPYVSTEQAAAAGAEAVALDVLLRESDFVSLHAAVTPETTGLLGPDQLAAMKPGACLVNTARAALLDEDALIAELQDGRLGGAALDTFAVEPPGSDHPLLSLPNVIATPHVGGNTVDVAAHQGEIVVGELSRLLAGEAPRYAVNPSVLDGFSWSGPRKTPPADVLARLKEGPAPAVSDLQKKDKAGKKEAAEKPTAAPATAPVRESTPGLLPAETCAAMRAVCDAFVEEIVADDAMRTFSIDRSVTLHFTLEDADCSFHFSLADGNVTGALGDPEESADVQLRMRADMLDGMFTGRTNPMEAAMEGRLAFTGDAAKAMTLQHLQDDLQRLYLAARERADDPGDLTVTEGTSGAAPVVPGDVREDLVEIVKELYEGQVITATGGNVSVRIQGEDAAWITPSQLFKGDLRPEVLVRIDLDGRSLDAGSRSPSSEWDMHCAILKARPEAKAVIHAHAPNATILANSGLPFSPISTEAAFFGDIPRVPFIMPGTPELADAVAEAMADGWAVLMVNHGIVVAGRTLRRAADMVEIVERSAEIILGCHAVGKTPPTLPEDVVKQLREMGDLVA
jgi:sugar (pentulose or hexulose) kinase/phosphoglycerate dehydrogenase-like enzyme/ribulose-5-phosphate 4-epimerase/fuculose-1-phosphate aldolase/putative sterol carrier protein